MRMCLAVALLLTTVASASCADFNAPILDQDGKAVSDDLTTGAPGKPCNEDGAKKCLTLGDAVSHAFLTPYPDENPPPSPEEKNRRGWVGLRLKSEKDVQLSAEDTALAKRLIAKLYGPIVVYRVWSMLDPASTPK